MSTKKTIRELDGSLRGSFNKVSNGYTIREEKDLLTSFTYIISKAVVSKTAS
jgi:hypothetical protein